MIDLIHRVSKLQLRRRRRHLTLPENQRLWKQNQPRYRIQGESGFDKWHQVPCIVPVPTDPESWLFWQSDLIFFGLEEKFSRPFP